ncbi:hypothetical protein C8J56DRAFT_1008035 [Mycena floridula]|nr:hypothetical protein C8J56DRAFT_1008035 [Mycena floridula]
MYSLPLPEAFIQKGSINPSGEIPGNVVEAVLSYRMMLQEDWQWVKGGKFPDGGVGDSAYGSTGRRQHERFNNEWLADLLRIKLWIQGKSVIYVDGLTLRDSSEGRIKGMYFQTFFGGHTADWACPKAQRAWFADVTGAIVS